MGLQPVHYNGDFQHSPLGGAGDLFHSGTVNDTAEGSYGAKRDRLLSLKGLHGVKEYFNISQQLTIISTELATQGGRDSAVAWMVSSADD